MTRLEPDRDPGRVARRRWLALLGAVSLAVTSLGGAHAVAQRGRARARGDVEVEVVDVSADRAYVRPGESAGVRAGVEVRVGRRAFRVVSATATYAMIAIEDHALEVGARGVAEVEAAAESATPSTREPPAPPESYRDAWPATSTPSAAQTPEPVPLGQTSSGPRRLDLVLSSAGALYAPLDDRGAMLGRGEIRARVRARPFDDVPLTLLADLSAQLWLADDLDARSGNGSRPWARVRELQIVYGEGPDVRAALGRLRRPATTLGALDGLSVRTPVFENVTLGAFGGFVPNPRDQAPDFETGRFGAEVGWSDPRDPWRPSLAVIAHGSYFDGAIDERRLSAQAQLLPDGGRLGTHVELSLHDEVNPWNAPMLEVSAAGIDGSVRLGPVEIGARLDRRLPERSRWLARWLPGAWLCAPRLVAGSDPLACAGIDDARWTGSLDVGARWDQGFVRASGTVIHHPSDAQLSQLSGFAAIRVVRVLDVLHGDLGFHAATGAWLDTFAGNASLGLALPDELLDVSVRYRLAYAIDRADVSGWIEHQIGGAVRITPLEELQIWAEVDGITGREVQALLAQLGVSWHAQL